MSCPPDSATLLTRALERQCPGIKVTDARSTRWASATFSGARHRISLAASPSAAVDAWLAGLPEIEFDLRGHLVADIAISSVHRLAAETLVEVEALTVEEN